MDVRDPTVWAKHRQTVYKDPIPELEVLLRLHCFVWDNSEISEEELSLLLPPWVEIYGVADGVPVIPSAPEDLLPTWHDGSGRLTRELWDVLSGLLPGEWGGLPYWAGTENGPHEAKRRFRERFRQRLPEETGVSAEDFDVLKEQDPEWTLRLVYQTLWSLYP